MPENSPDSIVNQRISNPAKLSDVEITARFIIEQQNAPDRFLIGYAEDALLTFFLCQTERSTGHFRIESSTHIGHELGQLLRQAPTFDLTQINRLYYFKDGKYWYDDYFDPWLPFEDLNNKMLAQLDISNVECGLTVYMTGKGELVRHFSFRYAVQEKYACRVVMLPAFNSERYENDCQELFMLSNKYRTLKIKLLNEEASLERFSQTNDELFCVPLSNDTLDNGFWNDCSWRDILPDTNPDGIMNDIPVKYIKIRTYVDGFQNTYVSVSDLYHHMKNTVIDKVMDETIPFN